LINDSFAEPRTQCATDLLSRVDFGSRERQKAFFREARDRTGSWKNLYAQVSGTTHISLTLRKLRRWCLGQALPTAETVAAICDVTGREICNLGVVFRGRNWGQRKGGCKKVETHGCNLTLQDRMIGGKLTGRSNSVDRLKTIASIGGSRGAKSPKNPRRRILGPGGVRMFNRLERDTFNELVQQRLQVEYEPVIQIGSRRMIPDFRVGSTYIECTADLKVNVKGPILRQRFQLLRHKVPFRRGIVVTLPFLVPRYKHYLGIDSEVVTVHDLGRTITN
jgi:hypothetical protein